MPHVKHANFGRRIRFSVFAIMILTRLVLFASAQKKTEAKGDTTGYQNFNVQIFCCIQDEQKMIADPQWLEESWNLITRSIKIEKVYVETYRDNEILPEANVKKLKNFFAAKGVKVSGGIMASSPVLPATVSTGSATRIPLTGKNSEKLWRILLPFSMKSFSTTCSFLTAGAIYAKRQKET